MAAECGNYYPKRKKPHGMILVILIGSGKSTTLYTVLSILNTKTVNISTIEDPVEYRIVGQPDAGEPENRFDFALGLRALKTVPEYYYDRRNRDKKPRRSRARAMTGHIVFSTLYTNNAPPRLRLLL